MGLRPGKVAPRLRRDVGEFKAYPLAMARTRANQIPLMDVFVALLTHLHQKAANAVKGVKDDKATKAIMTKMKWVLTVSPAGFHSTHDAASLRHQLDFLLSNIQPGTDTDLYYVHVLLKEFVFFGAAGACYLGRRCDQLHAPGRYQGRPDHRIG